MFQEVSMLIQYLLYPLQQFYEVYTIYAFIVQKKKLKFREVKWLSPVHTAIKGRARILASRTQL